MKITKSQLKQIIKEEFVGAIDEGFMDMFKKKSALAAGKPLKWGIPISGGGGKMQEPATPDQIAKAIATAIIQTHDISNQFIDAHINLRRWGDPPYMGRLAAPPAAPNVAAKQGKGYLPGGYAYLYYEKAPGTKRVWHNPLEDEAWVKLIQQHTDQLWQRAAAGHMKDYEKYLKDYSEERKKATVRQRADRRASGKPTQSLPKQRYVGAVKPQHARGVDPYAAARKIGRGSGQGYHSTTEGVSPTYESISHDKLNQIIMEEVQSYLYEEKDHPGESCEKAHPGQEHEEWVVTIAEVSSEKGLERVRETKE